MTIIPQIFQDYSDVGNIYHWDNITYVSGVNEWKRVYHPNVNIHCHELSDDFRDGVMVLLVNALSYSDYSGSAHNASNYRVFLEEFGDIPGVHEVYGGHGTCGVALEHKALKNEAIQEVLAALAQYGVLDGNDLEQLEQDAYAEAWGNYGCTDFRQAIRMKFYAEYYDSSCQDLGDLLDEVDYDAFQSLYESLIPSGAYYSPQCGDSVYLPIENAVKALTYDALLAFLASV